MAGLRYIEEPLVTFCVGHEIAMRFVLRKGVRRVVHDLEATVPFWKIVSPYLN